MAITGQVKRPGIYEVKNNETIDNIIDFASGYRLNAYRNGIYLNRFDNHFKRKVDVIYKKSVKKMAAFIKQERVKNGDVIFIKSKPTDIYGYIHIMGNVNIPGKYSFRKKLTLGDVISQSESKN